MSNNTLAHYVITDLGDNPLKNITYKVVDVKGSPIVYGTTNSKGETYKFSRKKGTQVNLLVRLRVIGYQKIDTSYLASSEMEIRQKFMGWVLDVELQKHQGGKGSYLRKTHKVQDGEYLGTIAKKYNTTYQAIARLNNLNDPYTIYPGDILKIPPKSTKGSSSSNSSSASNQPIKPQKLTGTYIVKQGDTLSGIAARSGKTENELMQANNIRDRHKIQAGQRIVIPDSDNSGANETEAPNPNRNSKTTPITPITTDARSESTRAPKTVAQTIGCDVSSNIIKKGDKSNLILEVNIRLSGFGGALPTDEFTDLTERCIKQFQRDYMGVSETGKICGCLLTAIDEFNKKYPVSPYFDQMKCPCGGCQGFGNGRMGVPSGKNIANEYPGIHRSVVWMLKATMFYLENTYSKKYTLRLINSSYRCIIDNKAKERTTVNHMGMAFDLHFNKDGVRTKHTPDMEKIREEIFIKHMNATLERARNQIWLEPSTWKSGTPAARTWVHYDVNMYDNKYKKLSFYAKTVGSMIGESVVSHIENNQILACSGNLQTATLKDVLTLSKQDIIDLIKVTSTEVAHWIKNQTAFEQQTAGVVDTILNRVQSEKWGSSVRSVVNAYRQFSKITGPASLKPYGSVQNMPWSHVVSRTKKYVITYLQLRANGQPSIIGQHLNYANKYHSDSYNREKWVDAFHDEAVRNGLILGAGKAVHAHGTVSELIDSKPKPFDIKLPTNFSEIK